MTFTHDSTRYEEVADEYGYEVDAFIAYCYNHHIPADKCEEAIDDFDKSYIDSFSSHEHFVRNYMEENGDWVVLPDYIRNHINWERVFSQELGHDFWEQNGYYFLNI